MSDLTIKSAAAGLLRVSSYAVLADNLSLASICSMETRKLVEESIELIIGVSGDFRRVDESRRVFDRYHRVYVTAFSTGGCGFLSVKTLLFWGKRWNGPL